MRRRVAADPGIDMADPGALRHLQQVEGAVVAGSDGGAKVLGKGGPANYRR